METMQSRLRSKYLWVAIFALVAFILGNYGLYDAIGMTNESFQTFVDMLLNIAVLVGIINNPTDSVNW